jgi:hypothetical protein
MSRVLIAVVSLFAMFAGSLPAQADRYETRVAIFYDELAPYGRWVDHRIYGTIWIPASGEPGWHPYTEGRWVWTSDYGWYWDSHEEFGWATYHYGRWVLTAEYGWAWVPDDVWGPAWVDWRYGDGYVGWSPMPPEHRWRRGSGAEARVEAGVDLGSPRYAGTWTFVSDRDFVAADVRAHRMPASRSPSLLSASARVTNYTSVNGRIVNRSIDRARIAAAAKVAIEPVRLGVAASAKERTRIRAAGSVPLYWPRAAGAAKLDAGTGLDLSGPAVRYDSDAKFDAPAPPPVRGTVEGEVDAGVGIEMERPITRAPRTGGGGIGIGVGGGGGLGLGR